MLRGMVRMRETTCFGLKYLFWLPEMGLEMARLTPQLEITPKSPLKKNKNIQRLMAK